MNILIADDDFEDVETLLDVVNNIDPSIKANHVTNGVELLQYLSKSIILPDFIFLDIYMPKMNGCECLMELRKNARFKEIPVIIYTASDAQANSDDWDIKFCKNLGVLNFLSKSNPFQKSVDHLVSIFFVVVPI